MIKRLILDLKKQYAVPAYDLDNTKNISEETIDF